jgi:hypothetical protein
VYNDVFYRQPLDLCYIFNRLIKMTYILFIFSELLYIII